MPKSGMFRFFRTKSGMLWFVSPFFASSSSITAFVATQQLCRSAIRTKTACGVRYVACHVEVSLLLSFLGPPWCRWEFQLVRCWLFCSNVFLGCVCLSHVSGWLRLIEVFAAVPLGLCLAFSVVSGSGDTLNGKLGTTSEVFHNTTS